MIRFRCPNCEAKMEVDDAFAGRAARCATCGENLKIPRQSEVTPRHPAAPVRPGAATVKIEGEKVEVVPPVDTTAYVALGMVGFAVLLFVVVLIVALMTNLMPPLVSASGFGAVFSAIGAMIGLSAWNTIKRSRGRRRGGKLATAALAAGGGLCVLFVVGAVIGWAQFYYRQPCEKNLEMIYAALQQYASKHDGNMPPADPGLKGLVADGDLARSEFLTCPDIGGLPGTVNYLYVPDISVNPAYKSLFPPKMLLVYDSEPHPDGMFRCLLLDGSIINIATKDWTRYRDPQEKQWQEIQKEIRIRKGLIPRPAPPAPTPTTPPPGREEEAPTPPAGALPAVPPGILPAASPSATPTAAPKVTPTAAPKAVATPTVTVPLPPAVPPKATGTVPPGAK